MNNDEKMKAIIEDLDRMGKELMTSGMTGYGHSLRDKAKNLKEMMEESR